MQPHFAAFRLTVPRQYLPPATSLMNAFHTRDNLWTGGVAGLVATLPQSQKRAGVAVWRDCQAKSASPG